QLQLLSFGDRSRFGMRERPAEDFREMIVVLETVGADVSSRRLLASRRDVERVLGARETDVHDAPPLPDGKRDSRCARGGLRVARMLLAAPALHYETQAVSVEEKALGVPRTRRSQVDQEDNRELETFGRVDGQQGDCLRFGR